MWISSLYFSHLLPSSYCAFLKVYQEAFCCPVLYITPVSCSNEHRLFVCGFPTYYHSLPSHIVLFYCEFGLFQALGLDDMYFSSSFHTYDYARHFVSACTRILGLEGTPEGVEDQGKLTRIAAVRPIDHFVFSFNICVVQKILFL